MNHGAARMHTKQLTHRSRAPGISRSSSSANKLAEKQKSIEIAAATGCDPRTALRAIQNGADVIKPLRLREQIRPYVEEFRAGRVA
jgi:uncharacterized NAD-dependent epimerase/dehydratase family protein